MKSEAASQQKPASKQQSSESTLRQKKKARAHKAAVETLRVAEVKREIVDAKEKEGSTYDEIADYIELSLSGGFVVPDLIAEPELDYGVGDAMSGSTTERSITDDPEI